MPTIIKKWKKQKICSRVDFGVTADHRKKIKENKEKNEYWDLAIGQRKQLNMRLTVIPLAIGALETVPGSFETGLEVLEIGGRAENVLTAAVVSSLCNG